MLTIDTPLLSKHSAFLRETKDEIADKWLENRHVIFLFEQYKISKSAFKKKFAISVIEHFVGVIEKKEKPGDCPIIRKFILYLADKNISAQDIFILCMALREAIIKHLFFYRFKISVA